MAVYRYFIVWIYWFIGLNFGLPGSLLKMETPFRKSFRKQSRHIGPESGHQVIKTKAKTIITHKRTQSLRQLLKEELYHKNQGKTTHCWRVIYICFYKSREDNSWWRVISTNKIWGSNQVLSDCIWKNNHPAYIKLYI